MVHRGEDAAGHFGEDDMSTTPETVIDPYTAEPGTIFMRNGEVRYVGDHYFTAPVMGAEVVGTDDWGTVVDVLRGEYLRVAWYFAETETTEHYSALTVRGC